MEPSAERGAKDQREGDERYAFTKEGRKRGVGDSKLQR